MPIAGDATTTLTAAGAAVRKTRSFFVFLAAARSKKNKLNGIYTDPPDTEMEYFRV